MKSKRKQKNNGYFLLETIFYICFFFIITFTVINVLIVISKSFKANSIKGELVQASFIVERISREIKQANDINTISSSDLILSTKDNAGNPKTVEFLLSGSNIVLKENAVTTGNLNDPGIVVSGLSFAQITTAKSLAVKFSVSLYSTRDVNQTISFQDTAVLRGKY